jgi:hypothetical protein
MGVSYYYYWVTGNQQKKISELELTIGDLNNTVDRVYHDGLMKGLEGINATKAEAYLNGLKDGRPPSLIDGEVIDAKDLKKIKEFLTKASLITSCREMELPEIYTGQTGELHYFILIALENKALHTYLVAVSLNSFEYFMYKQLETKFKLKKLTGQ